MNEYGNNVYNDDVEIDLVDLIFYFFKKWKVLIIAVIICAVAALGFWFIRDQQAEARAITSMEKVEEDYEIDDEAIANMEIAYAYRKLFEEQRDYNINSIIMRVDPNGYYEGRLMYYVSSVNDSFKLKYLYNYVIFEEGFYDDLAEASGLDCDGSYIKELVGFSSELDSISPVNLSDNDEAGEGTKPRGLAAVYTVIAPDEESCSNMLSAIDKKVQALNTECMKEFDDYSGEKISESVTLRTDNGRFGTQNTYINQMNTYLTNAEKYEDSLSDEEYEYYEKVFLNVDLNEETEDESEEEIEGEDSALSSRVSRPSLSRYLIFGVFAGIMIWGCFYLVKYLMDSSIKTAGEVKDTYNLPMFGRIKTEGTAKKDFVDRLYSRVKGDYDTPAYVLSVIETLDKDNIALCGNEECPAALSVMDELAKGAGNLSVNEFTSKSTDALKRVKEAGSEIIVVKVGETKRSEVKRELEICSMQNIRVLGMVAVEES